MRPLPAKAYWFGVVKAVERHRNGASVAVATLRRMVETGESDLPDGLSLRDLRALAGGEGIGLGEVEKTFFIRLFAAFEEACRRCCLDHIQRRSRRVGAEDLLDSLQNRYPLRITPDLLAEVHAARNYRNDLVHLNEGFRPIPFEEARRHLARFLNGLPDDWLLPEQVA